MLELMRKHARNWIMKLLLGIIIVVFVFYFGSLRGREQADTIFILDGKAVYLADFYREYEKLIDLFRNRLGIPLTEEQLKSLNLKQQAFDSLIKEAIILKIAQESGLEVAAEEIQDAITSNPAFLRNGVFDRRLYEETLRLNKMSPEIYEKATQKFLLAKKIEDLVYEGTPVSDSELMDLYRMQKEKINIQFLHLSFRDYLDNVEIKGEKLELYFKEHKSEFTLPEQYRVKYLFFAADDYEPKGEVNLSKEERYKKAMQLALQAAKMAHDTIYQQENFDAYAKEKGFKIYESPFFSAKALPDYFSHLNNFTKEVLTLKEREISRVLADERGYYLFQLAVKKPARIPEFSEVQKDVEKRVREREAQSLCKKEAEILLDRLKKGENIVKIAQEKKIKIEETGFFLPGKEVPHLGILGPEREVLYTLSQNKPYPNEAIPVADGYVIVRFKERGTIDLQEFENSKKDLRKIFQELKAAEALTFFIDGMKERLLKEGRLKIKKTVNDL